MNNGINIEQYYQEITNRNNTSTHINFNHNKEPPTKLQDILRLIENGRINEKYILGEYANNEYQILDINGNSLPIYGKEYENLQYLRIKELIFAHTRPITGILSPISGGILKKDDTYKYIGLYPILQLQMIDEFIEHNHYDPMHLLEEIIIPLAENLHALHSNSIIHGSLNHNNIFINTRKEVLINEYFSQVCGKEQLPFYQTIGQLQSDLYGKDAQDPKVDIYAVGMLLFHLFSLPYNYTSQQILELKIQLGTFGLIQKIGFTTKKNIPQIYKDMIYGLTMDNQDKTWNLSYFIRAIKKGEYATPIVLYHTNNSIKFNEKDIRSVQELLYEMQQNWEKAREFVKQDILIHWLAIIPKYQKTVTIINEMNQSLKNNYNINRLINKNDEKLIKTMIVLDPYGPLRLFDDIFYIGSTGTMFLSAYFKNKEQSLKNLADFIFGDLSFFYDQISIKIKDYSSPLSSLLSNASKNFRQSGFIYGVDRLIYDLNPNLYCFSHLLKVPIYKVYNLIAHLEHHPTLELLTNKNIMSFLASKLSKDYNKSLQEGIESLNYKEIAALKLLCVVQNVYNIGPLIKIENTFKSIIRDLVEQTLHSKTIIKDLQSEINNIKGGRLINLWRAIVNTDHIKNDYSGYIIALKKVENLEFDIHYLQDEKRITDQAFEMGIKFAVQFSYTLTGFIILILMLKSL